MAGSEVQYKNTNKGQNLNNLHHLGCRFKYENILNVDALNAIWIGEDTCVIVNFAVPNNQTARFMF